MNRILQRNPWHRAPLVLAEGELWSPAGLAGCAGWNLLPWGLGMLSSPSRADSTEGFISLLIVEP